MKKLFKIELDLLRNIPFIIDAIIALGIGSRLLLKSTPGNTPFLIGVGLVIFGLVQFIRNLKTFHLTETDLIVKRPIFTFPMAEVKFPISTIKEIRFTNIKGRFGGPHLTVISTVKNDDFRIQTKTRNIDLFETELKRRGVKTKRTGM